MVEALAEAAPRWPFTVCWLDALSRGKSLGRGVLIAGRWAEEGIRVNAIAPGMTDTAQPRYQFNEDEMREQSDLVPLGAMAQPGDIADIIVFLASDASRFMTGELVHANGGLYMG